MTREEATIQSLLLHIESLEETIKALEQEPILDKIRAEIEGIEINGYIRDVECFNEGINVALNVINKYKSESDGEFKVSGSPNIKLEEDVPYNERRE